MDSQIVAQIIRRACAQEPFAVGILAQVQGSAPQKAGARLLVSPDGTMAGTVGGGCLEMETRRRALHALHTDAPSLFELRLDEDFGWDDGLICGGRTTLLVSPHPERMTNGLQAALRATERGERAMLATVLASPHPDAVGLTVCLPGDEGGVCTALPFFIAPPPTVRPVVQEENGWRVLVESVRPAPRLVVMGCGHIGVALVALAANLGFHVTAVDDRADYAHADRLPNAAQVVCDDMLRVAQTLPTGPDTFWVIVTRGHRNDGGVLSHLITRPHAYIGMIGSRRKVRLIREGLLEKNITTPDGLANLHSPIGLPIGAETPQEIALSIAAELVAVRRGLSKIV